MKKPNKRARKKSKTTRSLENFISSLENNPNSALHCVLEEFRRQYANTGAGLCHDIATAIIQDVTQTSRDQAKWSWCSGSIEGVSHSWVEVDGHGIDMDDTSNKMRIWTASARPFPAATDAIRRTVNETLQWIADQPQR